MFIHKVLLLCSIVASALLPFSHGFNQAYAMEDLKPNIEEIKTLSEEVRNLYYGLVISQAKRPQKGTPAHDWMRGSSQLGERLKTKLMLNEESAKTNGLIHFYKKFLTSDQEFFGIQIVARMQGACSDHNKNYAATFYDSTKNSQTYEGGNVLLKSYQPGSGAPFPVTLYSFLVGSLKEITNFKDLTSNEIAQIKKNLLAFKKEIQEAHT